MPVVAVVDGVRIVVWPNDHPPPRIHAPLADDGERISTETGDCLSGNLPGRKMRSVLDGLNAYRDELAFAWSELRAGRDPGRVG